MSEFWRSCEVPQLELRRSCREVTCYRPHTHDGFSIGLIDSGSAVFSGATHEPVPLAAGDVILIPAGKVHACNPDNDRWQYQMLHADQNWITTLIGRDPHSSVELLAGISIFHRPALHLRFDNFNDLLFSNVGVTQIEQELSDILCECARTGPDKRFSIANDPTLVARLHPVLDWLACDAPAPVLSELAELAEMNKYQLIRAVKRATGLTPVSWRQDQRIIAARKMLRDGHSLVETANTLGFTDQSHFHRVFRAHVAATPGEYQG